MSRTTRLCFALYSAAAVHAFAPLNPTASLRPSMKLHAGPEVDVARFQFFLWFFGASGGGGIAVGAFPRMYGSVRKIQNLKGVGPTLGGPTVGLSPLCGYPEDIAVADVNQLLDMSVNDIVAENPVEGNFLAESGYLTFKAFEQAYADANPLAVRAVFDTFNTSGDTVSPDQAQEKLDLYKEDPTAVAGQLLKAKLNGYSSIGFLLFLLGLAAVTSATAAKDGWFPEWPGFDNFPFSLFSPEGGVTKIPDYWLDY